MALEDRLARLRAGIRVLSAGLPVGRAALDDEPTTGVHRIDRIARPAPELASIASDAPGDASDEDRIVGLIDAHRTRVEALRCELALAARVLDAIAAHDLVRVRALESESERAAPRATCPPLDLGVLGATAHPARTAGVDPDPAEPDDDGLDFPEVRAVEARLRAALAASAIDGLRRP